MNGLCRTVLCLGLLLSAGCRIEDHTPTGSRRDEEAVQTLVSRYARTLSDRDWNGARALFWPDATYSGPMLPTDGGVHQAIPIDLALGMIARRVEGLDPARFDVRVLRSDYRQDGDLAAVWLTTQRLLPVAGSVGGRRVDRAPRPAADRRGVADPEPRRDRLAPRGSA
jgi:hypothetical protein